MRPIYFDPAETHGHQWSVQTDRGTLRRRASAQVVFHILRSDGLTNLAARSRIRRAQELALCGCDREEQDAIHFAERVIARFQKRFP